MPTLITSTITRETFDGNGSTVTPYPLAIQRENDDHLHVLVDGVETGDFTIDEDGMRTGVAVDPGTEVIVYRETPQTQTNPFPANTTPAPEDVRVGLNKVTLIVQEVDERIVENYVELGDAETADLPVVNTPLAAALGALADAAAADATAKANAAQAAAAADATAKANAAQAAAQAAAAADATAKADAKVSDVAYDPASWDGVSGVAPSKNAVRDKIEAVMAEIVGGAISFVGADPNVALPGMVQGVDGGDDTGLMPWTGLDAQTPGTIWSTDGEVLPPISGVWWHLERTAGFFRFQKFVNAVENIVIISSDLTDWPEDADWSGFGVTVTRTPENLPAVRHGQWIKSSSAWWQWDEDLDVWIPRFSNDSDPIAYNATLSSFRKLVISGADGSEIITISPL